MSTARVALPALLILIAACAPTGDAEVAAVTSSLALPAAACTLPKVGTGNVCDLGGGQLKFQATLPAGQQYVEVFARQNGIQNVANAIVASGTANPDGTATYAFVRAGYAAADAVEYRFYSYKPASPGVFTPGPAEQVWYAADVMPPASTTTTVPVAKDAAVIYSSYGTGPSADRNFGADPQVNIGEYHLTSEGLFGYSLAGIPAGAQIVKAELVIPPATAPGGPLVVLTLGRVSGAWSESTVTWNTKPAASFFRDVQVDAYATNRIDVTPDVTAALAAGEVSFSLAPSTAPSTDNIFIDAKERVGGTPTSLVVEWK